MSGTLRGTIGYIAPENAFTSTKSMESDVYSYGVVLLELITRKKAADDTFTDEGLDIVRWVGSVWSENKEIDVVVDKGLYDELYDSFVREQVTQVLQLALRCTQTEPSRRPSMREVVKQLEDVYASTSSGSKLK
ncbi:receptor-like protein kinase [Tanacetum coccineum]